VSWLPNRSSIRRAPSTTSRMLCAFIAIGACKQIKMPKDS
jgi:hypothetical protein